MFPILTLFILKTIGRNRFRDFKPWHKCCWLQYRNWSRGCPSMPTYYLIFFVLSSSNCISQGLKCHLIPIFLPETGTVPNMTETIPILPIMMSQNCLQRANIDNSNTKNPATNTRHHYWDFKPQWYFINTGRHSLANLAYSFKLTPSPALSFLASVWLQLGGLTFYCQLVGKFGLCPWASSI